jgi:hypothetical protein
MNKIVEIKFGSHLYGTSTENSDLDLKGVYLPTRAELLTENFRRTIQTKRPKAHGERNTKDDVDLEMVSLDRYLELLTQGQTMALDMLFAKETDFTEEGRLACVGKNREIWNEIFENRSRLLSKDVTSFVGYARKQASKYGIKGSRIAAVRAVVDVLKSLPQNAKLIECEPSLLGVIETTRHHVSLEKTPLVEIVKLPMHKDGPPEKYLQCCGRLCPFTNKVSDALKIYQKVFNDYGARALSAETNKGVDFKALSHAVRVNCEAIELLQTGKISLPLPNAGLILKIKKGEMPYKDVAHLIETGLAELERVRAESSLREKPDKQWADDFVARMYSEIAGEQWPLRPPRLQRLYSSIKPALQASGLIRIRKLVFGIYFQTKWRLKKFCKR